MRYVKARFDAYNRDEAYRFFVCESLRLAPQGQYLKKSYHEIIKFLNESNSKQPEKTGDEIAMDVISQAGLKAGG